MRGKAIRGGEGEEREHTAVTDSHALFDEPNGLFMDELYRSVWPGLIGQQERGEEGIRVLGIYRFEAQRNKENKKKNDE